MMEILPVIIGSVLFLMFATPIAVIFYLHFKTRGKVLVRVLGTQGVEEEYLLRPDGIATEPNKNKRSYIVKPKEKVSQIKVKNPKTKKEDLVYISDPNGTEISGSCHDSFYPAGFPKILQIKIPTMDCNEGNPNAINRYGKQEALNLTDRQLATIKKEQFSAVVLEASKDFDDLFQKLKGLRLGINKNIVYILLVIGVAATIGVAFLVWQNSQAIANIWG